ncbi:hypothetical protein ACPC37_14365 [Streptomyces griseoincarnatus]
MAGAELDKWKFHIDWWSMLPPGRPTRKELSFIRECAHSLDASSALIMGSTPEYRDLCHELGIADVLVIDHSRSFHYHVSQQRVYHGTGEQVLFGRWQDLIPKFHDRFDLVLGDLVSGNVPYGERRALYASVCRSLTEEGLFIEKILTNRFGYQTLSCLMARYADAPINLDSVNRFANDFFFSSELVEKAHMVNVADIVRQLRKHFQGNVRLNRLLDASSKVVPPSGVWYYGRPWVEMEKEYRKIFRVRNIRKDTSTDSFLQRIEIFVSNSR